MMSNRGDNFRIAGQGERQKQLDDRVLLVAGVNPEDPRNPYFLPVGPNGLKVTGSGEQVPDHDATTIEKYAGTNNIRYIRYRVGGTAGTIVATKEFFYEGGGAADDDELTGSQIT